LRQHREDVTELLSYYIDYFVESDSLPYRAFSVAAQNRLRNYDWPGNVRELKSIVHRLLILGTGESIEIDEVDAVLGTQPIFSGSDGMGFDFDLPLRQAREQFERAYIERHLRVTGGNVSQVAKVAGIERTHLYRKMKALTNLSAAEFLRKVKMEHAAQLLRTNKFRISEVISIVGFSDADYFRECFKSQFGMTPKAFIESQEK